MYVHFRPKDSLVITAEQAFEQQSNLRSLCAEREPAGLLSRSLYGAEEALKEYCGVRSKRPLKVLLPHGVMLHERHIDPVDRQARLPFVWCYPSYRVDVFHKEAIAEPVLSAAPYVYTCSLLKDQPALTRRGTIFFPQHVGFRDSLTDSRRALNAKFALELKSLPASFQPVSVCIFWADFQKDYHQPYLDAGLEVVCAGHSYDAEHHSRFAHLCSRHAFASGYHPEPSSSTHWLGNSFSNTMFYSIKSGCHYFNLASLLNQEKRRWFDNATRLIDVVAGPSQLNVEKRLYDLFFEPSDRFTHDQIELINYLLGVEYLKTPRELRFFLLKCDFAYYYRSTDQYKAYGWRHWISGDGNDK